MPVETYGDFEIRMSLMKRDDGRANVVHFRPRERLLMVRFESASGDSLDSLKSLIDSGDLAHQVYAEAAASAADVAAFQQRLEAAAARYESSVGDSGSTRSDDKNAFGNELAAAVTTAANELWHAREAAEVLKAGNLKGNYPAPV